MKPILAILLVALVCVNHQIQFANARYPLTSFSKLETLSLFKRDASQQSSEDSESYSSSSSDSSDESSVSNPGETRENSQISSTPPTTATPHQSIPTETPPCTESESETNSPPKQVGIIERVEGTITKAEEGITTTVQTAIRNVFKFIKLIVDGIKAAVEKQIKLVLDTLSAPFRAVKLIQNVISGMMNPKEAISRFIRDVGDYDSEELSNAMKMAPSIVRAIAQRTTRELSRSMKINPRRIRNIAENNIAESVNSLIPDPSNIRSISEYISEVSSNSLKLAPRSIRSAVENASSRVSAHDILQKFNTLVQNMANAPPKERERYIQIAREVWCLSTQWLGYGTCSKKDLPDIVALYNQLSWQVTVDNYLTWIRDHLNVLTAYGLITSERAQSWASVIQTLKSLIKLMAILEGTQ